MTVASTTQNPVRAVAYYGSSLTTMTQDGLLLVDQVALKLAPGQSSARLRRYYGRMTFGGPWRTIAALDLGGQYVKVATVASGTETALFYGRVANSRTASAGSFDDPATGGRIATGHTEYEVLGVESILDQITFDRTYADNPLSPGTALSLDTFYDFEENRSAAKVGASYVYDWSASAVRWTALDVAEYCLRIANAVGPLTWSLAGVSAYLANVTLRIDPRGKSLRQVINEAIRPTDQFSWVPVVNASTGAVALTVVSLSDADIAVGGTTICPANTNTVTLTDRVEQSRAVQHVAITKVEDSAYSVLEVYSEPIRVCARSAWTSPDQPAPWCRTGRLPNRRPTTPRRTRFGPRRSTSTCSPGSNCPTRGTARTTRART
jgi:hypothetical protein